MTPITDRRDQPTTAARAQARRIDCGVEPAPAGAASETDPAARAAPAPRSPGDPRRGPVRAETTCRAARRSAPRRG
jgi:hypothetical protein